jgi:hypothetical protein
MASSLPPPVGMPQSCPQAKTIADSGRDKGLTLPFPPNRRAVFLHPALQSMGSYADDCPRQFVCRCQGQQPTAGKPCFRPALLGTLMPMPGSPTPLLQQTSQASSHIPIHRRKRVGLAVLDVAKPVAQTPVHVRHDGVQSPPGPPRGLRPQPLLYGSIPHGSSPQRSRLPLRYPFAF